MPPSLSRRTALWGALTLPLLVSACTNNEATPAADPDRIALEAALEVEQELLGVVERWNRSGRLPVDAINVVNNHVSTLGIALGKASPSPSPTGSSSYLLVPGGPSVSTQAVIAAADSATNKHTRALRSASPTITPLIASIAASDAAIAAFLRGGLA